MATGFGLVHGFGFSFALSERLQFAGSHLLTSLLAFNAGVEIAQLVVMAAAAAAVTLGFRRVSSPRVAAIVVSALAAHTGWDWLLERGAILWQFPWPAPSAAAVRAAAIWLALAVMAAAGAWGVRRVLRSARIRACLQTTPALPRGNGERAMNRNAITAVAFVVMFAGLGAAYLYLSRDVAAQARNAPQAPAFEVDPLWPKPLPNHWVLGLDDRRLGGRERSRLDHSSQLRHVGQQREGARAEAADR